MFESPSHLLKTTDDSNPIIQIQAIGLKFQSHKGICWNQYTTYYHYDTHLPSQS